MKQHHGTMCMERHAHKALRNHVLGNICRTTSQLMCSSRATCFVNDQGWKVLFLAPFILRRYSCAWLVVFLFSEPHFCIVFRSHLGVCVGGAAPRKWQGVLGGIWGFGLDLTRSGGFGLEMCLWGVGMGRWRSDRCGLGVELWR